MESPSPSLWYTTLEAADGHHVVLPAAAAERSRVLAYLFKGLTVMESCRRHASGSSSALPAGGPPPEPAEESEDPQADRYISFANRQTGSGLSSIVVPVHATTSQALRRVAQFLVMSSPNGRDAISDMNQNSEEDVEKVVEIVRAADLLHC